MPLFNCSFTLSGAQSPCSMYLGMIRIVLNVSAPCMLQQYARMGFAYICLELQVCKIRGACVFLSVFMLSASCLLVYIYWRPFLVTGPHKKPSTQLWVIPFHGFNQYIQMQSVEACSMSTINTKSECATAAKWIFDCRTYVPCQGPVWYSCVVPRKFNMKFAAFWRTHFL